MAAVRDMCVENAGVAMEGWRSGTIGVEGDCVVKLKLKCFREE
jgi:hypothetical protein